ncbi:hypothetical protein GV51_1134 [Gardnerella vaginalis 5-1]|nr:hypothetical protein GV51_1134 [Gardnerella vaginalis 5-1]
MDSSYSLAKRTLNPSSSKPNDNPPTPENKSITVGCIYLPSILDLAML